MTTPLLQTKLAIPPLRSGLVPRPRLIEQLNAGLHRRLTLISAPAGFGKTTLLLEWVHGTAFRYPNCETRNRIAWLSLDEGDNDPARFFFYLLAAFRQIDPRIGQTAVATLQSTEPPPPEMLLTSLLNDIATLPAPFALILDDYHLIHTLPIHQQLTFFLDHQPAQIHLIIATREDPPLPLPRLRARGQMVDIRQDDLRFTREEATSFLLQTMQIQLDSEDVEALQQRTEGWIAGLQLAALSLHAREDVHRLVQSFTGSHRYILDYLIEEVFQRQPAQIQDFLLKTSILDRLSASLCDAVVAREGSREVLMALEQSNLFITCLDESRQWYRYHRLFADLLRHYLDIEGQPITPLHQRASQWYAESGFPVEAIDHVLAASDWERAAGLIVSTSSAMMKRGELATLLGWYRALPDHVIHASPQLCLEYSWPLILTEQIDAAESYLDLAEESAQEDLPLLGEIAAARAFVARARGDNQRALALSEQALSLMPRGNLTLRSVVAVNLGIAQWYRGRLTEAQQALTEAEHAGRQSGNDYTRYTARVILSRIQAARGGLRAAAASYRQVIEQAEQLPIVSLAHIDLADLLYEWNDLEASSDHLQQAIELSQRSGGVEFQAGGYVRLAYIQQVQGQVAAVAPLLQNASQFVQHPGVSPPARLQNLVYRTLIALAEGDLHTASQLVEQFPDLEQVDVPSRLSLLLARTRLLLAQGSHAEAVEQLQLRQSIATQVGWQAVLIETRALQALAAPTSPEALDLLTEALLLAEPEGYVRTFLDLGEPMAALLRQAASRGVALAYVARLLTAFAAAADRETSIPRPAAVEPLSLAEPLSRRELDVLPLLAAGQTNQEIAQALYISVNTVKTHLKNIYSKVGVSSRRQAVARARELGLF